ncbi:E3 ubiquitin-protein ligase RNF8-like [Myzus persicae]|uniref:E3 ubiquitin-protein ligase RNF8-like n=1 Tax=Myzus persicae TaxID=13164 RepID=UPI000B9383E5|nr:E3 ubiquitin-protein ligase RNF8-like [Myzus persicae]
MELTRTNNYYRMLQDLKSLKEKNSKLNGKIEILTTSSNSLTTQLKEVKDRNAMLTLEFNADLLADKDYQCSICHEIFIKPVLLSCTHMFCKWCIDNWSKKNNCCPICLVPITSVVHCLSMNNFIEKRMEIMPAAIRLERKNLEEGRKEINNACVPYLNICNC